MSTSSRYDAPPTPEAQFEPGSYRRVLKNLLGVKRKRVMDRIEYEHLIQAQERYLRLITAETSFTASLLCQMHRDWLGEVYEWAGRYRTVNIEKGGFKWPPAARVPELMEAFERDYLRRYTPCTPAPIETVAERLAIVHAELLMIHPFREGNGRLARWLADLMAQQAGFTPPDYSFGAQRGSKRRREYLNTVLEGYLQNYAPLARFFLDALARSNTRGRLDLGLGNPRAPSNTLES